MKCPKCNTTLMMSERQGIEIDYCPDCRGIWLDRGELDKIIERSTQTQESVNHSYSNEHNKHDDYKYHDNYKHHDKYYKKKSWLNELFD